MATCTYDGTTTYQDVLKHFKDNGKGKTCKSTLTYILNLL
jgi:hypothetical protein